MTTKYRNISIDPRVSILLDNRANIESDFKNAFALTALGTANEIEDTDRAELTNLYLEKHTYLKDFVNSPQSVLIRVDVKEYILSGFTDVWTLRP
jgi:hypothetical protein